MCYELFLIIILSVSEKDVLLHPKNQITVGVVQLVRAPDCGSGGRGFEPHLPPLGSTPTRLLKCFFSCVCSLITQLRYDVLKR